MFGSFTRVILITLCAEKFNISLSEQMIQNNPKNFSDVSSCLLLILSPDLVFFLSDSFSIWSSDLLSPLSLDCMATDGQQWSADHLKPTHASWLPVRGTLSAYWWAGSEAPRRSAPRGSCSYWWRRRSAGWSGRVRWVCLHEPHLKLNIPVIMVCVCLRQKVELPDSPRSTFLLAFSPDRWAWCLKSEFCCVSALMCRQICSQTGRACFMWGKRELGACRVIAHFSLLSKWKGDV